MAASTSTCAVPPQLGWERLVERSIAAWETLQAEPEDFNSPSDTLRAYTCLDDFLQGVNNHAYEMFWFFQLRESFLTQNKTTRWSGDNLESYILIPGIEEHVNQNDCMFFSHFGGSETDPGMDGESLRAAQDDMRQQSWSYMWVDWTCIPQTPRSQPEERYFLTTLGAVSSLIRNCGFLYGYPPFQPRLWILYEVAECSMTATGGFPRSYDTVIYLNHVEEMKRDGVQTVLQRHQYRCSSERDRKFLTAWLELLLLLKAILVNLATFRSVLNHLTWLTTMKRYTLTTNEGPLVIERYEGIISFGGVQYRFSPLPDLRLPNRVTQAE